MLARLFKTLVSPIIEYGNTIWGPHFILDQRKLENLQRRATHLVENLHDKSYAERLQIMNLSTLKFRRLRGDLIFMYKLINNYFTTDFSHIFSFSNNNHTRGHQFKIYKQHSRLTCRYNYYFLMTGIVYPHKSLILNPLTFLNLY